MAKIGYARVSTRDQNLDRQLEQQCLIWVKDHFLYYLGTFINKCYNKSKKGAERELNSYVEPFKTVARITDLIRPTRSKVGTDYFLSLSLKIL